ncbi:cytosolic sulfotransferase 5-like [Hibiscus syriacus]|uniref:cytosolic sulfotransferase 5-like n=1 Tax=Hibiscus syriacus TaxID=106335 RepID=UPI001922E9D6|nr:cytosolic sulfotransferase 5-like [Hibiscus syriacus]
MSSSGSGQLSDESDSNMQPAEDDCERLMSSLPVEKGWVDRLCQFQGFWISPRKLRDVLTCQRRFQAQHTDVLLVTNPKSGTTWLKAIVFALMNRFRYPFADDNHPLLSHNPHVLVPFLRAELHVDGQVPSPRIIATHLPHHSLPDSVKDSPCKLVYLCRNPSDTFVSLWHFTNKIRSNGSGTEAVSLEESFDQFIGGVSVYGPYWDHVLGYWKASLESPERVSFLKYEGLKEQPKVQVSKLAEFLGRPFSSEEEANGALDGILKLCSFENLSNLEVNKTGTLASGEDFNNFFRRGEVGDAKNHLSPHMMEKLNQVIQEKLYGYGLKF